MLRFRLEGLAATVIALALLITAAPAHAAIAIGWAPTGGMNLGRSGASAVLLASGKVLVAGGDAPAGRTATAELYDPAAGTWTPAGSMTSSRTGFAMVRLANGTVLAMGGATATLAATSSAELYYPSEDKWRAVANMASARSRPNATLLPSGKVVVAGGADAAGTALSTAEEFDPNTNTWAPAGSFAGARVDAAMTLLQNGTALLAGGTGGTNTSTIFTPDTTWTAAGNMTIGARSSFSLTTLLDGRVLASGGNSGGTRVATAGLFDPINKAWSAAANMNSPHDSGTATLLAGGTVLEAGGIDAVGVSSATEVYDPRTNQWQSSGTLATPRYAHTATELPDGRVLIAGGFLNARLASAEIFTPTTSITADPAAAFADTQTGTTSTAAIQVTNSATGSSLLVGDFALSGANPGDFAVVANGCYGVPPGATCTVVVQFAPGAAGLRTATLKFGVNTNNGTQAVSLSGRGVAASPPLVSVPLQTITVGVSYAYKSTRKATSFQKLVIKSVPAGSTITVTCKKGCPRKRYVKRNAKGTVSIRAIVGRKHIKVGVTITVVVGHTGEIAAVKTIKIRKHKEPLVTTRCLPPGATKSTRC